MAKSAPAPTQPATILPDCDPFELEPFSQENREEEGESEGDDKGSGVGCLLLHGFTGTPRYMRELGEYLAARSIGVDCPRLPGHGTSPEDMIGTRWEDWAAEAERAFERVASQYDKVAVTGLSMGGMLALELAQQHSQEIASVVAMVPPIDLKWYIKLSLTLLGPFIKYWKRGEPKGVELAVLREYQAYKVFPIPCVKSLWKGLKRVRENLVKVTAPVLVIQGRLDNVIPEDSGAVILDRISSATKQFEMVEEAGHYVTIDRAKHEVFEHVERFITVNSAG